MLPIVDIDLFVGGIKYYWIRTVFFDDPKIVPLGTNKTEWTSKRIQINLYIYVGPIDTQKQLQTSI